MRYFLCYFTLLKASLRSVDRLARNLLRGLQGQEEVVCICTLKGASQFFHDMLAAMKRLNVESAHPIRFRPEYIRASSYLNTGSTGHVAITGIDPKSLAGKV